MTDHTIRRTGRAIAGVCFAAWLCATAYLTYRIFVAGLSPAQQRVADQLPARPRAALSEPLFVLLFLSLAAGVLIVASIVAYGYTQWRAARRRRLALERTAGRPEE